MVRATARIVRAARNRRTGIPRISGGAVAKQRAYRDESTEHPLPDIAPGVLIPPRCWRCPDCSQTRAALADLLAEHVADGVRAGNARRDRERRARQVLRGAPGAAALLMRAAAAGGATSRAALVEATSGPEKRALRWALRDDGDRPLSAERCRAAAADLARLTPGDLAGA